eukprot:TRINITY_DN54577_c0_g1_i1.p1 TRINITY_DN54577_c0_g1~~TRINITY_DN54577_c0_g1_i1.p1  ORF type:complete len:163 (-),score=62.23 TRINITY_DN54577_c0_g1_i1:87-515(-)
MASGEAEWKECFDLFDKDHDGKIQTSELGEVLRSLGFVLTEKEIATMKAEAGDSLLSWEKFKAFAGKKPKQPEKQAQALLQAFQVFDKGSTGQVDMAELKKVVTTLGEKLAPQEFEDICKAAGLPPTGGLEYKKVVDKVVKA